MSIFVGATSSSCGNASFATIARAEGKMAPKPQSHGKSVCELHPRTIDLQIADGCCC